MPKGDYLDLIKKYNLGHKLKGLQTEPMPAEIASSSLSTGQQSWSSDRKERQALLQRRREEMILNARRKMEEKQNQQDGR